MGDKDESGIAVWYIAIPNNMPQKTGFSDLVGITANQDVLDRCPLSWQRLPKDWFTAKQFEEMVLRCDARKKETGGWVFGQNEDATGNRKFRECD